MKVRSELGTSALQLVPVELRELAEDLGLVLQSDAHAAVRHLHAKHTARSSANLTQYKIQKTINKNIEGKSIIR